MIKAERYSHYHHGEKHAHAGEALNRPEEIQVNKHLRKEFDEPEKNDLFEKVKLQFMRHPSKMDAEKRR